MTEHQEQNISGNWTPKNYVLLVLFWTYVAIPFFWGLYETLTGVTTLFTG